MDENKLLGIPPRSVPSGTKLNVIKDGVGQRFPEVAQGTTRDSSASRRGRKRDLADHLPDKICLGVEAKNDIVLPFRDRREATRSRVPTAA
jgi:hypothetical protein